MDGSRGELDHRAGIDWNPIAKCLDAFSVAAVGPPPFGHDGRQGPDVAVEIGVASDEEIAAVGRTSDGQQATQAAQAAADVATNERVLAAAADQHAATGAAADELVVAVAT